MAAKSALTALLFAAALGACAELTAEAPLFAPTDQIGPPPLTEGVWIAVHEDCPAFYARRRVGRFPAECSPIEVRRLADGAWQLQLRVDLINNLSAEDRANTEAQYGPVRAIIAPAVEHPLSDGYSPLYLVEINPRTADDNIGYAVIAPIGVMPATSAMVVGSIGCVDILRDGPIEGVTPQYSEPPAGDPGASSGEQRAPTLSGCIAATQAAVREAARRAVIENLDEMSEARFVYVRPK